MRYVDGSAFYTVAEVADAAGVSAQTVREWERKGYFASQRSPGGHRMYSARVLVQIRDRAMQRRRRRANETTTGRDVSHPESVNWDWAATGARLRAAREDREMSQAQVAQQAGISRTSLSSIERGSTAASMHIFSQLADVLGLPMAALAPARPPGQEVMRVGDRPETVLSGGVLWQELAAPGYTLAPAFMFLDPGCDSGGYVTTSRENFVLVVTGRFEVQLASPEETIILDTGDALMLTAGRSHSWKNLDMDSPAQALWVERLAPPPVAIDADADA